MQLKTICRLETDDASVVERLVAGGMNVAAIPFALPRDTVLAVRGAVLAAFEKLNAPVGLMMSVPAGGDALAAAALATQGGFDFLMLEGGTTDSEGLRRLLPQNTQLVLCAKDAQDVPEQGFDMLYFTDPGAVKHDAGLLDRLARGAKQRLLPAASLGALPFDADGVLFERPEDFFAAMPQGGFEPAMPPRAAAGFEGRLQSETAPALARRFTMAPFPNARETTAAAALLYAASCGASAVIAMTADGQNIKALASCYAEIPIIAVANRKLYEKLLLSLSGCYGVFPTAITKIPDNDDDVLPFAREVAKLYGYRDGEQVVVTAHYNIDASEYSLHILTI